MKQVSLFLLILLLPSAIYAQIDWGAYSHSFPDEATDKPSTVALVVAVPKENDSFGVNINNSFDLYKFTADSSLLHVRPARFVTRMTFDTARAHLFLHGVNSANAMAYQFRITERPTYRVMVPWQSIGQFTNSALVRSSGLPRMAYLGGYKASLGRTLVVDVRETGGEQMVTTAVIAWVPIRPVISNQYTSSNLDAFFRKLQYPWAGKSRSNQSEQFADSLTLAATNTNLILLLQAEIYSKEQVQYELMREGHVVIPWRNNDYDNSFIWLKDYTPGAYRLNIRYAAQPQHVTEFRFNVAPAWYQTQRFQLLSGVTITASLVALALLLLYLRQKQNEHREQANKTKLQLELKAIYAQLNPHFVFNALSSIQGLINKQDIQGANNYLSDFARLMRESLTNSHKEGISLHEEIRGLETYLKLEQLRFGFEYQISVDESINPYDSNVPALLVQPLVENAVKHGVAALGEAGLVTIHIDQKGDAMAIRVIDNGKGFPADQPTGGFGLKLTRDRIKLLNELNPTQPIRLETTARLPSGTEVMLVFTHWFT